MKLTLLALILTAASTTAAHAQVGIYATYDALYNKETIVSPAAGIQPNIHSWLSGPTIGVYANLFRMGPVTLGPDLRVDILHGDGENRTGGLLGLRLAGHAPVFPLRPYAQAAAGFAHRSSSTSSNSENVFEYRIAGGVDYAFLPHVDWRIIEVAGGSFAGQDTAHFSKTDAIVTLSSGIVIRLP